MCEPARPIDTLKSLCFSIQSLAELTPKGSYQRANIENASTGIVANLRWAIANIEMAGEGQRNFGLSMFADAKIPDKNPDKR